MTSTRADGRPFAGKVAVITGSTQGLGEAVARCFAERGAAGIVVTGRNQARGRAVAEALEAAGVNRAVFVAADLDDPDAADTIMRQCDEAFGRVDCLVNAAAITDRGSILDTSCGLFDRMFAVNVRAPFFLIQAAARIMRRERSGGTVVNILSTSSYGGQPHLAAYASSKAALGALTRNAAYALMRDGIRLNGLNIGWMNTPGEHAIQTTTHQAPADWLAQAGQGLPLGRLLEPDEVARAVAYLCADESRPMTGALVDFDQSVQGAGDPPRPMERLED